jgi:hypothetical protein
MTAEEILEGKRIIAVFMGAKFASKNSFRKYPEGLEDLEFYMGRSILLQDLDYESSWDCLLPVVEKIESIYDENHGYFGVYISSNQGTIQGTKFDPIKTPEAYYCQTYGKTKREAVFVAIVEFIKWYNQNIKS